MHKTLINILFIFLIGCSNNHLERNLQANILVDSFKSQGSGVAFQYQDKVYILTAEHVAASNVKFYIVKNDILKNEYLIKRYDDIDIVKDGMFITKAKILLVDELNDLALLECYKYFDTQNGLNVSKQLPKVGSPIYMIGNVKGGMYINSLSVGITSYYGRHLNNTGILDQGNISIIPRLFWWRRLS